MLIRLSLVTLKDATNPRIGSLLVPRSEIGKFSTGSAAPYQQTNATAANIKTATELQTRIHLTFARDI
jgi:hypothetical protein